jgi:tRNA threonylcarbamoyladenosine biosynthesis protein TsaB
MLIVGIDTSGRSGSVALVRFQAGERGDCGAIETLELQPLAGGTYSATLMPQLASMLARHSVEKSVLDGFAVASGPGSFTGLRVGLATVKALADALAKPIAAVSTLDAVAWKSKAEGQILVALDAGRGQVFAGEFLAEGRMRTPLREWLLTRAEFFEELKAGELPVYTPDPELAEALLPSGMTIFVVEPPLADLYAHIGAERILAGNTVSPAELDANYIRRSDAEIFFKP